MLTIEIIAGAVREAAAEYPVRRAYLFGSYADGTATDRSDVDLYVEFLQAPISFFKFCGFRAKLSHLLSAEIDIVKEPPQGAEAERMALIYEA